MNPTVYSKSFKFHPDYMDTGCAILADRNYVFTSGVNILGGCNGSGKTTLLRQLKDQLESSNIPVIAFNNLTDGVEYVKGMAALQQDWNLVGTAMCSSEGENVILALGQMAEKIGRFCRNYQGEPELWFLFDAIDSGLSIDNIIEVKEHLFNFLIRENPDSTVYIVAAANSFEMVRGERHIDVNTGFSGYFHDHDYESYRSFILNSRELKNKRVYTK